MAISGCAMSAVQHVGGGRATGYADDTGTRLT